MKKNFMLNLLSLIPAVMLMTCGNDDSSGPIPVGQFTLTLASAGTNSMTLTSNFNCIDCPIFKNGLLYLKVTTTSNVPYGFPVSPPNCYRSGGNMFLYGYVWSNYLCAQ